MSQLIDRLLSVARAEVGYTEFPAGSNRNKFAAEIAPAYQSQPWCAIFTSWAFQKAGAPLPVLNIAGGGFTYCPAAVGYARQHGETTGLPQPGDIALYDWEHDGLSDHVGIVSRGVDSTGHFTAIEGNTSLGNNSNGGAVMERSRSVRDVLVFWHPVVLDTPDPPPVPPTVEEDLLSGLMFEVGPILTGDLAGRWCKVRPELDQRQLRCEIGAWEDGPGVEQLPAYVTSILHLDRADLVAALGHPLDWPNVSVGQSAADPHVIVVHDKDGDYAFRVA